MPDELTYPKLVPKERLHEGPVAKLVLHEATYFTIMSQGLPGANSCHGARDQGALARDTKGLAQRSGMRALARRAQF